jgi:uncharacterized protein (TIGR02246 family)
MPTTTKSAREDAQVRQSLEALAQALSAKDVDALMAHYAPDVVTFDVGAPLEVKGVEAYRKNFERWFASVQGPIDYTMRDLRIATGDGVAFCHCLSHVESTRKSGEKNDYWVRVTSGLRKANGRWLVTHEHISMPFYMETMQAARDLQP